MTSGLRTLCLSTAVFALFLAGCSDDTTPMTPPLSASATPASSVPVTPTSPASPSTTSPVPVTTGAEHVSAQPLPVPSTPEDVTTGLTAPWSVAFLDGVALVSERDSGRILELGADGTAREVGVIEEVRAGGEGGLLGLAVDQQKMLYAYYTTARDNRIVRFDLTGSPGNLALGEKTVILEGLNKSTTHNGGRIAFGPDGMLYASAGDAGVPQRSQDSQSLAGKILRMTSDGAVPPDNPFEGSLVWSLGHRNVQGMAWTTDGTMFATEFGQNTWDELNVIEPGNNYGWPVVEGIAGNANFVDPVQQWTPGEASPSGMAYVDGTLYIANLRGQRLRSVDVSDPSAAHEFFDGTYGRLRDVAVAPDGALWIMNNNTDGRGDPHPGDDRILAVSPDALKS